MEKIIVESEKFSNGKAKSFRKGIVDSLIDDCDHKEPIPDGHEATYKKGITFGLDLKEKIKALENKD